MISRHGLFTVYKYFIGSPGFTQFGFKLFNASVFFAQRRYLMTTANKGLIAVGLAFFTPFIQRVIIDSELFCGRFGTDFIGQLERL